VFDWTILKYPQIGSNPRMRVCNRLVFLFDVRFVVCWTYSICLSLFRQGKELVELLDPQWIRLRRSQVFPALERMCNKSMIQTGHMLGHDFCAGEVSGRRNPSGSVNQSDNYAQRPRETVSMSLKEIVS
jgi:hypothetical protein